MRSREAKPDYSDHSVAAENRAPGLPHRPSDFTLMTNSLLTTTVEVFYTSAVQYCASTRGDQTKHRRLQPRLSTNASSSQISGLRKSGYSMFKSLLPFGNKNSDRNSEKPHRKKRRFRTELNFYGSQLGPR